MSWQPARPGGIAGSVAVAGLVVLVTGVIFTGFGANSVPAGEQRTAEETNVHEAVLRYQFLHNASAQRAGAKVFCLTVARVDADDDFLRRFAGDGVPVRKASACKVDSNGVFDKATGAQGLQLAVDTVTWVAGDQVTVRGGYYEASESASSNVYRLKKTAKGWVVVEDRLVLIS